MELDYEVAAKDPTPLLDPENTTEHVIKHFFNVLSLFGLILLICATAYFNRSEIADSDVFQFFISIFTDPLGFVKTCMQSQGFWNYVFIQVFLGCMTIGACVGFEYYYNHKTRYAKIALSISFCFLYTAILIAINFLLPGPGSSREINTFMSFPAFLTFFMIGVCFITFLVDKLFNRNYPFEDSPIDEPETHVFSIEREQKKIVRVGLVSKVFKNIDRIRNISPFVLLVWVLAVCTPMTAVFLLVEYGIYSQYFGDLFQSSFGFNNNFRKVFNEEEGFRFARNFLCLIGGVWISSTFINVFSFFMGSIIGESRRNISLLNVIGISVRKTLNNIVFLLKGNIFTIFMVSILYLVKELVFYLLAFLIQFGIEKTMRSERSSRNWNFMEKHGSEILVYSFLHFFLNLVVYTIGLVSYCTKYLMLGMLPEDSLTIIDKYRYIEEKQSLGTLYILAVITSIAILAIIALLIYQFSGARLRIGSAEVRVETGLLGEEMFNNAFDHLSYIFRITIPRAIFFFFQLIFFVFPIVESCMKGREDLKRHTSHYIRREERIHQAIENEKIMAGLRAAAKEKKEE